MKSFIYPEMLVYIPMCTHKLPSHVLLASDDASLLTSELDRYHTSTVTTIPMTSLLESLRPLEDNRSDVILIDGHSCDAATLAHLNRILNETGLMVMSHPSLDDVTANTALMEILGHYFKIIMPYYVGNGSTLLLCSKEYHPTADIILQRSDLLEGLEFYNCDVHTAVFAMPNYVRKNYLGIIRN